MAPSKFLSERCLNFLEFQFQFLKTQFAPLLGNEQVSLRQARGSHLAKLSIWEPVRQSQTMIQCNKGQGYNAIIDNDTIQCRTLQSRTMAAISFSGYHMSAQSVWIRRSLLFHPPCCRVRFNRFESIAVSFSFPSCRSMSPFHPCESTSVSFSLQTASFDPYESIGVSLWCPYSIRLNPFPSILLCLLIRLNPWGSPSLCTLLH